MFACLVYMGFLRSAVVDAIQTAKGGMNTSCKLINECQLGFIENVYSQQFAILLQCLGVHEYFSFVGVKNFYKART